MQDGPAKLDLRAFITGCAGACLSAAERAFFRDARPAGLILFRRNCQDPAQVRALIAAFRDCLGTADALILIDQEGGRVQRLAPPHWPAYPPARTFGRLYERDKAAGLKTARICARLIAADLAALDINTNCTPVLDLPVCGANLIIGDRAFADQPEPAIALGRAVAEAYLQGGVLPVIKHIPGHGRARADSHKSLPVVATPLAALSAHDFAPFAALSDLPLAMTAHILFPALDPNLPVSTSPKIIAEIIRGAIGFDGLLMSDDLAMEALSGSARARAAAILNAGCDIALHCNGRLGEMEQVAEQAPMLSGVAAVRFTRALARLRPPEPFDARTARRELQQMLVERI